MPYYPKINKGIMAFAMLLIFFALCALFQLLKYMWSILGRMWIIIIVATIIITLSVVIFLRFGTKKARIKKKARALRNDEIKKLTMIKLRNEETLFSLSPYEFEDFIAAMYHKLGYKVAQTPYSGDFGFDVIASKDGMEYIVECKQYKSGKRVGYPVLQRLYAAMIERNADKAICVATCDFAKTAYTYVENKNIELINLDKLSLLMCEAFGNIENDDHVKVMCLKCGDIVNFEIADNLMEKKCVNGHMVRNNLNDIKLSPGIILDKLYCDKCGKEMQLRTGIHGRFWGCTGYPYCKNTKPYKPSPK